MKKGFIFVYIFFTLILFQCSSVQVIPEPNLDQVTVKSEPVCTVFTWYWPFCTQGRAKSFLIKGIYNNSTGEKKYFLDYHLDMLDTDLPVGISVYLDGVYYNLKKVSTDYSDILKIESEINLDLISKMNSAKNNFSFSYSNRKETHNFTLSSGDTKDFLKQLNDVVKRINAQEKLKIVN
ncbi:MAG TPA: hypothetical protein PK079_21440 [Leptospiraceae bacterium]|nr:hypothetical protein [Leptospiraceae bacterium]HMW03657.1 hypothetical protein [Leptospiraceae bacterium]HMX31216.1 hypothetical protein [Leptospiraceae bacterium]HMY29422.1 hypothetical protein [Leptospiraceae bacterium]HMZ65832.1 hypothetical protein [Leptospiraceae bacterium]